MSSPARVLITSLTAAATASDLEIGRRGVALSQLAAAGLPTPHASILTAAFLEHVLQFNRLQPKLHALLTRPPGDQAADTRLSHSLQELIINQQLPPTLHTAFIDEYVTWMEDTFVAVRPSQISSHHQTAHLSELPVTGESNIFESVLKVWSKWYQPEFLSDRREEWKKGLIVPGAIIIQEMIDATSSGSVQMSGDKLTICSSWGIGQATIDEFIVNPKTGKVTAQNIALKTQLSVFRSDEIYYQPVPPTKQAEPSLSEIQIAALLPLVTKIKKHILGAQRIEWVIREETILILQVFTHLAKDEIASLSTPSHKHTKPSIHELPKTHTHLIVDLPTQIIGHHKEASVPPEIDGLRIKSGELFATMGTHPQEYFHQDRAASLKKQLEAMISKYVEQYQPKALFYQTHDWTSETFAKLKHGHDYEDREDNPEIGYRGTVRILRDYQLFDLELDVLLDISEKHHVPINVIVSHARTSTEVVLLLKHLHKHAPARTNTSTATSFYRLWIECTTPSLLLHLAECLKSSEPGTPELGVMLNLDHLQALYHGIDPTQVELTELYPSDPELTELLFIQLSHGLRHHKRPITIQTAQPSRDILEHAVSLKTENLIVPPTQLYSTKLHLSEVELEMTKR